MNWPTFFFYLKITETLIEIGIFHFCKMCCWHLNRDHINSAGQLGLRLHDNNIENSNPWPGMPSLDFKTSLISFNIVFSLLQTAIWLKLFTNSNFSLEDYLKGFEYEIMPSLNRSILLFHLQFECLSFILWCSFNT